MSMRFLFGWAAAGMAAGVAVTAAAGFGWLWQPPELVGVVMGAAFVWAGWIFGAWWTTR